MEEGVFWGSRIQRFALRSANLDASESLCVGRQDITVRKEQVWEKETHLRADRKESEERTQGKIEPSREYPR